MQQNQHPQPYKPSFLDKSATTAFVGTLATWGFYYANIKYGLTNHIPMSQTTYDWTVGGLPEFFGAWFATSFPAALVDEIKGFALQFNHHKAKIPHPLTTAIVIGGAATTLGILDEIYSYSGGTSDEWDVARYAAGFTIGLTSTLFHKQHKKKSTLEELL